MSAALVSGEILIAERPRGGAPRPAKIEQRTDEPRERGRAPGWPELLGYYRDAVRLEAAKTPLLPVRSSDYVCMPGRERILVGDVDDDECVPVPPGADTLIAKAMDDNGPQLWVGWPSVVFLPARRGQQPEFAPLLMRQVDVVETDNGRRLRPIGGILPHPGLARAVLPEEEAEHLTATYQPTWHDGEYMCMAEDAGKLLTELNVRVVEELRPQSLADEVGTATPMDGARNAAVLFGLSLGSFHNKLLDDLATMIEKSGYIANTALAAMVTGAIRAPGASAPQLVTPRPANAAQRAVLNSAMTRRLTVATGPPGTGKSQLVVNAVATAIANDQSVLVASTNNRAVDEVWNRCEEIIPGMLVRTGNQKRREQEMLGLESLLALDPPERSPETLALAYRHAGQHHAAAERSLHEQAEREARLLDVGRHRASLQEQVGRTATDLATALGTGWGRRARASARAAWWAFGPVRRRRLLERAGLGVRDDDPAQLCAMLADLAEVEEEWQTLREAAAASPVDRAIDRALSTADDGLVQASKNLVVGTVRRGAVAGHHTIEELLDVQRKNGPDWKQRLPALKYAHGWAVSSLMARRFPCRDRLFDLVIIDEASQCSIPSVLPLLYRAKRALVIGDAKQLPHISHPSPETDAALRKRHHIAADWIVQRRLSAAQHSAFAAAERAAGEALLLDEHYRCHPEIVAIPNRRFYGNRLTVLTDLTQRPTVKGSALTWQHVAGRAERGPSGRSWRNRAEADEVCRRVHELLATVPEADIGVVTPYRAQATEIEQRLGAVDNRVQVGTVHTFQGSERDIMIMSLVAAHGVPPRSFNFADQQPELWNVAITRARVQLIVVGDETVWEQRGGVGAELLTATRPRDNAGPPLREDLADRLYGALAQSPDLEFDLGIAVRGHRADAVISRDGGSHPIVVDIGATPGVEPAVHLRRMLRRRALLGEGAARVQAWQLFDEQHDLVEKVVGRTAAPDVSA